MNECVSSRKVVATLSDDMYKKIIEFENSCDCFVSSLEKASGKRTPDLCGTLVRLLVRALMQELRKTLDLQISRMTLDE